MLRLVQDHQPEGNIRQLVDVPADQGIGRDEHLHIPYFFHMADLAGTLRAGAVEHHHRQIRCEAVQLAEPVIRQGGGRHHQGHPVILLPVYIQHQRNHLHRFSQTHVVGQDAAHMKPVQRFQPVIATLLIGPQRQPRGQGHIVLPGRCQCRHRLADAFVNLNGQMAVFQQAGKVAGTVGIQRNGVFPHIDLICAFQARGLIDAVRQLLPRFHIAQVQEGTIFEAEILAPLGQRLQYAHHFLHGFAVLREGNFQVVSMQAHASAKHRPAWGHLLEILAQVYLALRLQLANALGDKVVNGLLSGEVYASLAHVKSSIGQGIQHLSLRCRVPQQQLFPLGQGFILLMLVEGINFFVPIAQECAGDNLLAFLVQVNTRNQGQLHQLFFQLAVHVHHTRKLEEGDQLPNDPCRLPGGIVKDALPVILLCQQHPQHAVLAMVHRHHATGEYPVGAAGCQGNKILGEARRHRKAPQGACDAIIQRKLGLPYPLNMVGLSIHRHAEGQMLHGVQHRRRKRFRQCHDPQLCPPQADTGVLLCQAQCAQNIQHTVFRRGKVHPFRLEGKALAKGQGHTCIHALYKLRNASHHIQPVFPHTDAHAQLRFLPGSLAVIHQGYLHVQGAILRQRAFHGVHQPWSSRGGLAPEQFLQRACFLCQQRGSHHMAACPAALIYFAVAAGRRILGKNNLLARRACHHIAQHMCSSFQHPHASTLVHGFAGLPFFVARQYF